MRISLENTIDKMIWCMTVALFVAFMVLERYSWGKYAILGISVLLLVMAAIKNNGLLRLRFQTYHGLLFLFALYVLINSLWALSADDTVSKATTLFLILAIRIRMIPVPC